eukprot:s1369_g3.t1
MQRNRLHMQRNRLHKPTEFAEKKQNRLHKPTEFAEKKQNRLRSGRREFTLATFMRSCLQQTTFIEVTFESQLRDRKLRQLEFHKVLQEHKPNSGSLLLYNGSEFCAAPSRRPNHTRLLWVSKSQVMSFETRLERIRRDAAEQAAQADRIRREEAEQAAQADRIRREEAEQAAQAERVRREEAEQRREDAIKALQQLQKQEQEREQQEEQEQAQEAQEQKPAREQEPEREQEHDPSKVADMEQVEPVFRLLDRFFVFVFTLELLMRLAERSEFRKEWTNWLDVILVVLGLVDFYFSLQVESGDVVPKDIVLLRLVRALKSLRAFRMMRSFRLFRGLRLLVKACQCFLPSLCWAMVLLGVFMTMGALIMGNLLQSFLTDDTANFEDKEAPTS